MGGGHAPVVPHVGAEELFDVGHKGIYQRRTGSWEKSLQWPQLQASAHRDALAPAGDRAAALRWGLLSAQCCPPARESPGKGDLLSVAHVSLPAGHGEAAPGRGWPLGWAVTHPAPEARGRRTQGKLGLVPREEPSLKSRWKAPSSCQDTCSAHGRQRPPREAIETYMPVLPHLEGPPVLGAAGLLT